MKTTFTNCKLFTIRTLAIGSIALFSILISKAQNPLITENHFNIITEGNLTISQGDIEGAIAVGGNLVVLGNSQRTSANATGGQAFMTINNIKYALVVNGGLTGTNGGNIFKIDGKGAATDDHFIRFDNIGSSTAAGNGGGIDIGNPVTDNTRRYVRVNSTNQAANTVVNTAELFSFSSAFSAFRASATSIATCTGNVTPTVSGGQATLNLGTFSNNVWNVTGATLNSYSQINLTGNLPTASRPLIINVNAAGTFNWSNLKFVMGSESDNSMEINRAPYILWNFYNATTLNIQSSNLVLGSILAPNANLRNNGSGNITGQIVAKTFTKPNAGELHIAKFNANVTCDVNCISPTVSISGTNLICTGSSTTLTANGGDTDATYMWTINTDGNEVAAGTSQAITVSPSNSARYRVTVTNPNGCQGVSTIIVYHKSCTCANNLLVNGSFEDGLLVPNGTGDQNIMPPSGWFGGLEASQPYINTNNVPDGTGFGYTNSTNSGKLYQDVTVTPGSVYSVSFYATAHVAQGQTVTLQYLNSSGIAIGTPASFTINAVYPTWTSLTTLSLPAAPYEAAKVRVSANSTGTNGANVAKIDGVCLTSTCTIWSNPNNVTICSGSNIPSLSFKSSPAYSGYVQWCAYSQKLPDGQNPYENITNKIGCLSPEAYYTIGNATTTISVTNLTGLPPNNTNAPIKYFVYACIKPVNPNCTTTWILHEVTVNPASNAGSDGSTTVCESSTTEINLNDLITNEQISGAWTRLTGTGGTFTATTGRFTPAVGTTNSTFQYKITGIAPCVDDVSIATVNITAAPTAPSVSKMDPTCTVTTGSLTITPVSGITYSIDGGTFAATPLTVSGLAAGSTHTIVAKNNSGCTSGVTSIAIGNVLPVPAMPEVTKIDPTCTTTTGSLTITAVSGLTYSIDGGAFSATILSASGLPAGSTHTVVAKNSNGCISPTTSVIIGNVPQKGSIGDFVFIDSNGNGIIDSGELPLPNVSVSLFNADANGVSIGAAIATTSSNSIGIYNFPNLCASNYVVQFGTAATYTRTIQPNTVGKDPTDSDANPTTGFTGLITIVAGENDMTNDAGYFKPASLGNYVWEDNNVNGQQDSGEPFIANVTVSLQDATGNQALDVNGNPVPNTTTNGVGEYNFTNLKPGVEYVVVFSKPAGYVPTTTNSGNDNTDSDANPTTGKSQVVTLSSGENNLTIDAGFFKPASLGNYVWEDKNLNGQQDGTEPAIPNVVVSLQDASGNHALDANGNVTPSTITNGLGEYNFTNLKPGTGYVVVFSKPAGYTSTAPNLGNDNSDSDANVSDGKSPVITLVASENNLTIDAGFYKIASLGNYVWEDKNLNGQQDSGEPGIPNVTVSLQDALGNPALDINGNPVSNTTTNGTGEYNFTNLKPGIPYVVVFSKPAGYYPTVANSGSDASDSDANITDGKAPIVVLTSGEYNQTIDAGFYKPAIIGNFVWEDKNANGQQESGEPGIPNVSVSLQDATGNPALDINGNPVPSTTTNGNGEYIFTNLMPGVPYIVVFSKPSSYTTTPVNTGDDNSDSDANKLTGKSQPVTLQSGEYNQTVDAGYYKMASLGNYAWYDANRNGVQDGGELPAGGVLVELFKSNGTLVGTKNTDSNGLYLFDNLTPGDYYIRGTHSDSFFKPTTANVDPNDEIDSDISADVSLRTSITTSLESGEIDLTWDMGYYRGAKFNISDPCLCKNDATNLVNGRYDEEVTITGTPGEIWTVKAQTGIFTEESPTPPAAGIPLPIGTIIPESPIGSGIFILMFEHVDAIGYEIFVTNETTPGIDPTAIFNGDQTNVCFYPEPNYNKITNSACSNAQPIELTAQPNMPGAIKYTLSNVNTQQLIEILPDGNGKFFINPANVPTAKYDLIIEFTPTDPAKCKQLEVLTAEFEVKTCAPLPVNLVSFDAKNIDDKVVLNWKTSSEKNFSHFEVQYSENLSEFNSIGTVNSNLTGLYSLIDNNPNTGNNYYRLKMVDNNGSFEFSKTVAVQVNKNEGYVIAENPAVNGQFSVNTNMKNPHFNLYNSLATKVSFNLKAEGENKFSIAVTNYSAGTYYLTINSEGKIITKKIIIP